MATNDILYIPAGSSTNRLQGGEKGALWLFGDLITYKERGNDCSTSFFEIITSPQGGPLPHRHLKQDEGIYVLEGSFIFPIDGQQIEAGPGAFVFIPKGAVHSYQNVGTTPGKMLTWFTPVGGAERFFDEVGLPVSDPMKPPVLPEPPDFGIIRAAALHNDMEFVMTADDLAARGIHLN